MAKMMKMSSMKMSAMKSSMKMSAMKSSMKKMSVMKSGMKKLNAYFVMMLDAKKKNLPSFVYNGKTYVKTTLPTGITSYKKK
jgi:uncharacterized protein (DUF608 family)